MFSASITDAVLFSTKKTCVISTQKQDRKCSAEPAEIILDILKNLKVCGAKKIFQEDVDDAMTEYDDVRYNVHVPGVE